MTNTFCSAGQCKLHPWCRLSCFYIFVFIGKGGGVVGKENNTGKLQECCRRGGIFFSSEL